MSESAKARGDAPAVRVRAATPADADRLALLGRSTFLESYAHLLPVEDILGHTARQHAPEVYAAWLADPRCGLWLAEVEAGHAPVAYLVATPPDLPSVEAGPDDLEIRRIYVLHRYKGQGLGRQLMQAVADLAHRTGKRRLLLGVYSRNREALAFYDQLGFARAGTREFRVGNHSYHDYILGRAP